SEKERIHSCPTPGPEIFGSLPPSLREKRHPFSGNSPTQNTSTARPIKFCSWPLRLSAGRETRNVTVWVDSRPSRTPITLGAVIKVVRTVHCAAPSQETPLPHSGRCGPLSPTAASGPTRQARSAKSGSTRVPPRQPLSTTHSPPPPVVFTAQRRGTTQSLDK
ncbi:MAG: hypothetical protein RL077_1274, partial [Verrucomicrobiota bacterium]